MAGLILLAPSPAWGQPATSALKLASGPALATLQGAYWLGTVAPDWSVVRDYTLDRLPVAQARTLHARMRPESGRALFEIVSWWADVTAAARVPALNVPALVITGALDRGHTSDSTAPPAARLGADALVLPRVSHWTLDGPGADAGLRNALEWLERR